MDLDIVFLQEVHDDQLNIPGFNIITNIDHTKRGTAILLKEHIKYTHIERSLDSRILAVRIHESITLCNVYAPSGTQNRAEREKLFNTSIAHYLRHNTLYTLLAGDFNAVIRSRDSTGNSNFSRSLANLTQQLHLTDAWTTLRGNLDGFTYITHNSAARLDRLYVSVCMKEQLRTAEIHACSFTNHHALTVRLCLPSLGKDHGRGYWSLHPRLLDADTLVELRTKWTYWTRQRRHYTSWMSWWQEYVKHRLKAFFRWKSTESYLALQQQHQHLYSQLSSAYVEYQRDPAALSKINKIKGQMLSLQRKHSEAVFRNNETRVAGESLSTYHLGERRRKRTIIDQLQTDDQRTLENQNEIQNHVVSYFRDLYSAEERPPERDFVCNRVVPCDSESNNSSMNEITTPEIYQAIKSSASRKAAGPDGIPKEFYLYAFDIIHRELNLIMNEALKGDFSADFVAGVVVLVKKKQTANTVHGYRPISLLNFDYKLLARILKNRIERVLRSHEVLSSSQKCSNSEKTIFQATLAIKDKIAKLNKEKKSAKLISFDLDHAFDRVDRSFLYTTMKDLGFKPSLIALLRKIGDLSSSRLLINGHLSESFGIKCSVRQGDPLAMHLFVLFLHPLICKLEAVCSGDDDLIAVYADDISVVVSNPSKVDELRRLFQRFEICSGAKLNTNKTFAMDIGWCNQRNRWDVPWMRTTDQMKILGIIFTNSIRRMITINWDKLVGKFAQLLWLHKLRLLSLHQKVAVLNTFATSKLWYVSSVLTINTAHIAKITSLMGSFLWDGAAFRVPIHQLALPIEKGGLKLQLPYFKCKALLVYRHLAEMDSTPYYASHLVATQNPPNLPSIPSTLPCLKSVCQEFAYLPEQLRDSPHLSSSAVHGHFLSRADKPKIVQNHPGLLWTRIWKNISSKDLNTTERTCLYLTVNNKITHQELLFRTNRASTPNCEHCGSVDTLQHKLACCSRVSGAWALLQRKLQGVTAANLPFEALARPELRRIGRRTRAVILKIFANYVIFIAKVNGPVDISALDFFLQTEVHLVS